MPKLSPVKNSTTPVKINLSRSQDPCQPTMWNSRGNKEENDKEKMSNLTKKTKFYRTCQKKIKEEDSSANRSCQKNNSGGRRAHDGG